jgi:DNA end-binding protein Ku
LFRSCVKHRVKREFVDSESGDPVERENQGKGYEIDNGQYIVLERTKSP